MNFNHGQAKLKKNFHHLVAGDEGILTAYLPEDNKFAVLFGDEKGWHTFDMTLEEFTELFEVELN